MSSEIFHHLNPLSANHTKWSKRLKHFVCKSLRIFWVCLNHCEGLVPKGLILKKKKFLSRTLGISNLYPQSHKVKVYIQQRKLSLTSKKILGISGLISFFKTVLWCLTKCFLVRKYLFKEVRYNCSVHHFAHLFIIARGSQSYIKRKQSQKVFLQYRRSLTMIHIVKKHLWRKIHELNLQIRSPDKF